MRTWAKRDFFISKALRLIFAKVRNSTASTINALHNSIKFTLVIFTSVTSQNFADIKKVWKFNLAASRLCRTKTIKLSRHRTESTSNFVPRRYFRFLKKKKINPHHSGNMRNRDTSKIENFNILDVECDENDGKSSFLQTIIAYFFQQKWELWAMHNTFILLVFKNHD